MIHHRLPIKRPNRFTSWISNFQFQVFCQPHGLVNVNILLLRIFDFGILKLLSCKSTFSAKFIFIPYKSWSFLATFIFIFLITQIQTSVGDLTWLTQSANCRRDPSLSDQYHFQKDPLSISLPYHLETPPMLTLSTFRRKRSTFFPEPSFRSCFSSSTAGTGAIIWRGHKGRVKSRTTIFTNWPKSLWSWWPWWLC